MTEKSICRTIASRHSGATRLIAFSGVWLLFTWIVLANKYRDAAAITSPRVLYTALSISLLAIATIAAFRSHKKVVNDSDPLSNRKRKIDLIATAIMIAASLTLSLLGASSAPVNTFTLVVGGLGLGWLYVRWAEFYTLLNVRSMAVFLFAGSLLWVAAQVLFELSTPIVRSIGLVTLPGFAMIALWRAFGSLECKAADLRHDSNTGLRGFWKAWTSIVTVSLITAMLIGFQSTGTENSMLWRRILTVMFFAITMWIVLNPRYSVEFSSVWRVAFFALAISLTMLIIDRNSVLVFSFLRSSWQLLIPTVWLTVCDITRHINLNAHTVLGLGLISYSLPTALGGAAYHQLIKIADPLTLYALMLLLLFAVLGVCLSTRDPDTLRIFDELRGRTTPVQEFATIDNRCSQLSTSNNLTQREEEILKMLGKGRSRAYIAETLFISENTVKTHVGHVYAKLGVHSKRELQRLIDVD